MIKFEYIYVDLETAEVINIPKHAKNEWQIKEISRHWTYNKTDRKLTIIYSVKKSNQLKLWG